MQPSRLRLWPLSARTATVGAIACIAASGYMAVRLERPEGVGAISVHIDITLFVFAVFIAGVGLAVLALRRRVKPASKDGADVRPPGTARRR
jgi:hypothetical protein